MASIWVRVVLAATVLSIPSVALSQQRPEIGLEAIVMTTDPVTALGGVYAGAWVERRVRLAGTASLGGRGGAVAWRVEALGHFHLNPDGSGIGVYGGGGLALAGGASTQGYLVVLVGIEPSRAKARGWVAELGVGGGVRISIGYRWRQPFGS